MELLILTQNKKEHIFRNVETQKELAYKLIEESNEVLNEAYKQDYYNMALEVFDVIQLCIGILDKLSTEELISMTYMSEKHNAKLLDRGWEYDGVVKIEVI